MKIIQINKDIQDLHAIEHDINTRFPTFQFKDGLKPYDLSNCSVRVYGVNNLVNSFFNDLEIVNAKQGIAKLELTDTMLVRGTTKMQFVIMPNGGGQLKTKIFNLVNGESLVDSEAIEGTNEYKVFEEALKRLDSLIANGNETNKTLAYNIEQAKPLSQELTTKISNAESTKRELINKTQEGNALKENLTSLNAEAKSTKTELEQSISNGDIQQILSRIANLEKKGISSLWEGTVKNKGTTINLSESLMNFDKLLISYSFAGEMQDIVDLKLNSDAKILTGNLIDADSGATYSILEININKTNETTLTIAQNKEVVNGSTVNLNVGIIKKIEGIKF